MWSRLCPFATIENVNVTSQITIMATELSAKYNPSEVESKWYTYWMNHKLFASKPDHREPYTILMPPPNVTGVLHMGHMLNNTIQDILVRRARMTGKNACWIPGTDHASIATEAKVVQRLASQGIKKTDLSREEFLKHAWDWTEEHGGIILKQLRYLGASCDWDRTAFTMDELRSESVIKVFVDLYEKGMIYRGVRMVNWDPEALTALSDEEVVYKEEHGKLYYLRYKVEGDPDGRYAVVATTRPETIMGDTAMCINPNDPKNTWLKGKRVIVPLVGRSIPVIEDDYVDIEFGTGCLKVTPAHDVNDYMLGEKYNLPSIDIFNDNGTLNESAELYIGMDRFAVRKQIERDLEAADLLEKVEPYTNKVGYSERTNVVIEPKLSMQWFLKMDRLAEMALKPVMEDKLKFYPSRYKNTYRHWMENIKDWCVSRQLWWGHRIPAYFLPEGGYVVAATAEEALAKAKVKTGNDSLTMADLRPDEDCLDTWFSSWLWPISLFDGINKPGNEEMKYYYPTSDLVTGPDIIFFWVARMIMAGYEYEGDMPFRNVYFTGIVRDAKGRKMSKSLGNSPDPLHLIETYGADGVRMGLMTSAAAGNDILFDEAMCEQGRNFNNKIWNSFRLIQGWEVDASLPQSAAAQTAVMWFAELLKATSLELEDLFSKYRISDAMLLLYKLVKDDFSGTYLELIKPDYGAPIDAKTLEETNNFFDHILRLLHPFMPFITEELWQALSPRKEGDSLAVQQISKGEEGNKDIIDYMEIAREIVSAVRNLRASRNVSPREALELYAPEGAMCPWAVAVITKLANISEIKTGVLEGADVASFMIGTHTYSVPFTGFVNVEEELTKLADEEKYYEKFLASVRGKLSNEKFVSKAPEQVVALERKKESDALEKLENIRTRMAALKQ